MIVDFATKGELGLAIYHVEKEGLELFSAGQTLSSYAIREGDELLGVVQFYSGYAPAHIAGMSVMIVPAHRAQGKGLEGTKKALDLFWFNWPHIKRVEVYTAADNIAAQKGSLKLGFTKEATLSKWFPRGKEFIDAHLYAKVY